MLEVGAQQPGLSQLVEMVCRERASDVRRGRRLLAGDRRGLFAHVVVQPPAQGLIQAALPTGSFLRTPDLLPGILTMTLDKQCFTARV